MASRTWPFRTDFYQTEGIHGIDERVRADWFMDGVALTRRVVRGWAFEPLPAAGRTRSVTQPPQKPSESSPMKASSSS